MCGDCTYTYGDIQHVIAAAFEAPGFFVPIVGYMLAELESGAAAPGGAIEYVYSTFSPKTTFSSYFAAVPCLDAATPTTDLTLLAAQLDAMILTSPQIGPYVSSLNAQCAGKKSLNLWLMTLYNVK